jgi:hypothetical protein
VIVASHKKQPSTLGLISSFDRLRVAICRFGENTCLCNLLIFNLKLYHSQAAVKYALGYFFSYTTKIITGYLRSLDTYVPQMDLYSVQLIQANKIIKSF